MKTARRPYRAVPLLDSDFDAGDAYIARIIESNRHAASRQMQRHI